MSSLRGKYLSSHDKTGQNGGTIDTLVRTARHYHHGPAEYSALFYGIWTVENGFQKFVWFVKSSRNGFYSDFILIFIRQTFFI